MFSSTKSTAVKAPRSSVLRSARDAKVDRAINVGRDLPARALSSAAHRPASADLLGTATVFVASLILLAAGATMIARIWANLAMIR